MFDIKVDGTTIATQRLDGDRPGEFFTVDYSIPPELTGAKEHVMVRFEPAAGPNRCGPVFGVRIFTPRAADA